jgi:serine/threonine protein kinase
MTPREIHLLLQLNHANVIKGIDLLQNVDYFHLVMECAGQTTFDLFEFIETNPDVNEHIASHVFRQVVAAVAYLHGNGVLHRDIKDENVILNEQLEAKLIDFGSVRPPPPFCHIHYILNAQLEARWLALIPPPFLLFLPASGLHGGKVVCFDPPSLPPLPPCK